VAGKRKRHQKKDEAPPAEPQPGVAGMAQGQPAAGIEPQGQSDAADAAAEGFSEPKPEQAGKLATGAEALEEQQKNPDLKDNTGNRGGA